MTSRRELEKAVDDLETGGVKDPEVYVSWVDEEPSEEPADIVIDFGEVDT